MNKKICGMEFRKKNVLLKQSNVYTHVWLSLFKCLVKYTLSKLKCWHVLSNNLNDLLDIKCPCTYFASSVFNIFHRKGQINKLYNQGTLHCTTVTHKSDLAHQILIVKTKPKFPVKSISWYCTWQTLWQTWEKPSLFSSLLMVQCMSCSVLNHCL